MFLNHRILSALAALCALLLGSLSAQGQSPEDKAAAQVAFDKGLALLEGGKVAEACPLFEDSLRLDPAMGTQYQLAQCYEQSGRLASAWAGYTAVADGAQAAGMADREKWARERADGLKPRLSKLTIIVPAAVAALPGLTIERDGRAVPRTLWGVAIPVDGGSHRVVAKAPDRATFTGEATVAREKDSARLELPMLLSSAADGTSPPDGKPLPPAGDQPDAGAESGDDGSAQTIVGIVVAGVGAAVMVAGVAVGLAAKSSYDDAGDEHCVEEFCNADGLAGTDDARALGNVATGLFIGGSAALVSGVITWLTAPSGADDSAADVAASQRRFDLVGGPGQAGLGLRARW